MLKWVLLSASLCFSAPSDSLRMVQLEGRLIAAIETDIRRLATAQAASENKPLWTAGNHIQGSIWLSLIGSALASVGQIAASNGNYEVAAVGLIGGIGFGISGIIKMYAAGTEIKKASNHVLEPVTPAVTNEKSLIRGGNNPSAW